MMFLGEKVECASCRTSRAALRTEEEELALALALSMEAAQPQQDPARAGAVPREPNPGPACSEAKHAIHFGPLGPGVL